MLRRTLFMLAVAALAAAAGSDSARAQKAKNEMRVTINDMFSLVDPYVYPQDEAAVFNRTVFDTLIAQHEHGNELVGVVAKSWKIVQPGIYEFEIRDDLTFHSGNPLSADDVVHTFNFFANPAVNIRFKPIFDWFHPVEKIGPNTIRVTSKRPQSNELASLAYRSRIFDAKIHAKLDKYEEYGRVSASGTGPYKFISIDRNKVVLDRFADYKSGRQRRAVGRYVGVHIPDEQTQIAQLLTGGMDALRNISTDNSRNLANDPGLRTLDAPSGDLVYFLLDAAGRSANKVMTDVRVRQAVIKALDRDALIKEIVPGNGTAEKLGAICLDWWPECRYGTRTHDFDPAGARRLLAEAGLANGFDLVIDAHESIRDIATAIAGELRKVGIRANVNAMPVAAYGKRRGDGEFTMFLGFYPTASHPNLANMMDFFFGADRDYYNDGTIHTSIDKALVTFDDDARQTAYRPILDRVNEMSYILPLSTLPAAYAMTKDVKIMRNAYSVNAVYINDLVWADYDGQ